MTPLPAARSWVEVFRRLIATPGTSESLGRCDSISFEPLEPAMPAHDQLFAWQEDQPAYYERRRLKIPSASASNLRRFRLTFDRSTILKTTGAIFSSVEEAITWLNDNNPSRDVSISYVFCPDATPSQYSTFYVFDEPLFIGSPTPLELQRLLLRYPALWVRAPSPSKSRYQFNQNNFYTDQLQPPFHLTTQTLLGEFRRLILSPTVSQRVSTLRSNKAARISFLQSGGPLLPLRLFCDVDRHFFHPNLRSMHCSMELHVGTDQSVQDFRPQFLSTLSSVLTSLHESVRKNGLRRRTKNPLLFDPAHYAAVLSARPLIKALLPFCLPDPPSFDDAFNSLQSHLASRVPSWSSRHNRTPIFDLIEVPSHWSDEPPAFRIQQTPTSVPFPLRLVSLYSSYLRILSRIHGVPFGQPLPPPVSAVPPSESPSEPKSDPESESDF